jgi:hypothetical protein
MSAMSIVGIVVTIVLWGLVAGLALAAAVRSKALFREGAFEGARDFAMLIPRVLARWSGSRSGQPRSRAAPEPRR